MIQSNKRICIVATSLDHGGAERASAVQSIILHNLGFRVSIVTVKSGIAYNYKGEVFDLGVFKRERDSSLGRILRLLKLKRFLKDRKFDCIIDNRPRNQAYREFIINKFIYNIPTIFVIHSFESSLAFTKYTWLNRYLYHQKKMVCVSKLGAEKFKKLYDLKSISTIYNAFNFEEIQFNAQKEIPDSTPDKYILFYGRIHDKSKNLRLLIEAYFRSILKDKQIKLLLLGDGEDVEKVTCFIREKELDKHVLMKGFQENPFPYVKNAMFTVLTSRSEGFAMVLPESLCLGTPVISVNCDAGPKEIIKHGENGLLVENHNPEALAEAFNAFIDDEKLYNYCKSNSQKSIHRFSIDNISKDWNELLCKV